jgi:hypothetical protein
MLEGYEYFMFKKTDPGSDFRKVAGHLRDWALKSSLEVGPLAALDQEDSMTYFQILHLERALVCPKCKNIDNHVAVCKLCGEWVCIECGETIPPPSGAPESPKANGG